MKKKTNFSTVFGAMLLVLAVLCVVILVVDMPVAADGEELTVAQKVIVTIKTNINTLLATLGLTGTGAVCFLMKGITAALNKSSDTTKAQQSIDTISGTVEKMAEGQDTTAEDIKLLKNAMLVLFQVFESAEMPSLLKEQVKDTIKTLSTPVGKVKDKITQIVDFDGVVKAVTDKLAESKQVAEEIKTTVVDEIVEPLKRSIY